MSCPICGANCRCRKRGPGGICCGCHKHKPRAVRAELLAVKRSDLTAEVSVALDKHLEWLKKKDCPTLFGEVG
jgi:hypothetical protein